MAATPLDGKHVAVGKVDHPVFLWYRTLRANIVTGQQRPVETLQIVNDLRVAAAELDASSIKCLFCLLHLTLQLVLVIPVLATKRLILHSPVSPETRAEWPHTCGTSSLIDGSRQGLFASACTEKPITHHTKVADLRKVMHYFFKKFADHLLLYFSLLVMYLWTHHTTTPSVLSLK